jgi:hypothetical protein
MRRIFSLGGALLGLHILLFFMLAGYRDLGFRVGLLFTHGNDISDILRVEGVGFAVLAIAMVGAGILFELLLRRFRHGTRGSGG